MHGQELPNLRFPVSIESKIVLVFDESLFTLQSRRQNITSRKLFYSHFNVKCSYELHFLVRAFLTFSAKIRHDSQGSEPDFCQSMLTSVSTFIFIVMCVCVCLCL